ncbi:hypothetical protein P5G62_005630 [Neobacillus sp. 179-C4.2 HS]|uniref:HNH endonuclease n=1 Tax=Neobacillus driksii TaxID=3035913 RepID=A0ABV4YRU1_9BACI|nr:hypothetical protein [Neobacillus sp. 179.-C4.2 HS]MDP5197166.1 hypothetical protein [Neobacillus sp. 179.-C4.2 HS]
MNNHLFTIEGERVSGNYVVYEWKNGYSQIICEIKGRHHGGLKEARQMIGKYLKKNGHLLNKVIKHQCIKPGRKINPTHEWTVDEYLIGVPLKKE